MAAPLADYAVIETVAIAAYESKVRSAGPQNAQQWCSWKGLPPAERGEWRNHARDLIQEAKAQHEGK
uniref:Uncharacterized protein n=1 Tax=Caulobacter phage BL57 TaxID=3348355 RepID=A0AB74UN61_9VIRU